jgi:hypothetical protein
MSYLKALSLWQPWASLWLSPRKRHETRHWPTTYRGLLLVHAAKKIVKDIHPGDLLGAIIDDEFGPHWAMELPTGALIGVLNLVAIVPTETLPREQLAIKDFYCGDFSAERFAWRRGAYRRFAAPIPYRGHQGLFYVPYAVVAEQIAASAEVSA